MANQLHASLITLVSIKNIGIYPNIRHGSQKFRQVTPRWAEQNRGKNYPQFSFLAAAMGPGPLSGGAGAGTQSPVIYLLDTNIFIYSSKNRPPQVAELLRGTEGSQRREATLQQLEVLRRLVPRSSSGMSSLQARMGKWS